MTAYKNIEKLNQSFGLNGAIMFEPGQGGMIFANVKNAAAQARICLLGATVLEYQQLGQPNVLWASRQAVFQPGVGIRGGIPVCWPWFGVHTNPCYPSHGFGRGKIWKVIRATALDNRRTLLEFQLKDSADTRKLWPHAFDLRLRVTVGDALEAVLTTRNTGSQTFGFSGALHTYFEVGDVRNIKITGLENTPYACKVRNGQFQDAESITISGETNRMYQGTTSSCIIHDPDLRRRIVVEKGGSQTTVVWNPWQDRAATFPDMGDDEYLCMVCIESVVAPYEARQLQPGEEFSFSTTLRSEPIE